MMANFQGGFEDRLIYCIPSYDYLWPAWLWTPKNAEFWCVWPSFGGNDGECRNLGNCCWYLSFFWIRWWLIALEYMFFQHWFEHNVTSSCIFVAIVMYVYNIYIYIYTHIHSLQQCMSVWMHIDNTVPYNFELCEGTVVSGAKTCGTHGPLAAQRLYWSDGSNDGDNKV